MNFWLFPNSTTCKRLRPLPVGVSTSGTSKRHKVFADWVTEDPAVNYDSGPKGESVMSPSISNCTSDSESSTKLSCSTTLSCSSDSDSEFGDVNDADDDFKMFVSQVLSEHMPSLNAYGSAAVSDSIPCFEYDAIFDKQAPRISKRGVRMSATETLQLLWFKKHHVTEDCMTDLVNMVQHSSFNAKELKSISTIKRRVSCLPMNPSYALNVPRTDIHPLCDSDDDESNEPSLQTSQFVFASLKDKLKRVLQTPNLRAKVERTNNARFSSQSSEFCHGRRYMESPFFTIHEIEIRPGVFVELGDRIVLTSADNKAEEKYRVIGIAIDETDSKPVLRLRMYRHVTDSKLPLLAASQRRQLNIPLLRSANMTELVYTEEEFYLRDFSSILRNIRIGTGAGASLGFEFSCNWAIQGLQWVPVADIDSHPMDFKHFTETSKLVKEAERRGFQVFRLFLVLYIDGFGLYQRATHTTDGIYVTLGNLNRRDRHDLSNLWPLGKNVLCLPK
jgi:hypothetical protein